MGSGYDVTNRDPSNWVVLNDSFVTSSLSTGTDGKNVDYIASVFIVIDPSSSTGTVTFSQGHPGAGTGEFDIDKFVPPTNIPGFINVDYSVFSQDPNSPSFDPGSFVASGTVSANAQVDVVSAVPEPASALLTGLALLPTGVAVWRRRKRRHPDSSR